MDEGTLSMSTGWPDICCHCWAEVVDQSVLFSFHCSGSRCLLQAPWAVISSMRIWAWLLHLFHWEKPVLMGRPKDPLQVTRAPPVLLPPRVYRPGICYKVSPRPQATQAPLDSQPPNPGAHRPGLGDLGPTRLPSPRAHGPSQNPQRQRLAAPAPTTQLPDIFLHQLTAMIFILGLTSSLYVSCLKEACFKITQKISQLFLQ